MAKVVTLGEIMLRLSPPGNERLLQASSLDMNYGGAEANVAISLAQLGHDVAYVSKIPKHQIGQAAVGTLAKYGVDCKHIVRGGDRLGTYYMEYGASVRPSSVIYDRAYSAISLASPEEFDFDKIFEGVDLFHVSGITPVLSQNCAQITMEAIKAAKKHGAIISFDLNYRAKLWTSDVEEKRAVIAQMMPYVDICFGNPLDAAKCLGYQLEDQDIFSMPYSEIVSEEQMKKVLEFYQFKYLITTLRESISASKNGWSAAVCSDQGLYTGKRYLLHIVDRVGGGDSFAAGFLHGILSGMSCNDALEFAIAAAAIKHTIPGDINLATEKEILTLMHSDGSGRVVR